MEELERQSWANMQTLLKTEECFGMEYDENVICDVCRAVNKFKTIYCIFVIDFRPPFFYSLIQKKGMKWCFVTDAIFASIKPVMEF